MARGQFFGLTVSLLLLAAPCSNAQTITHRPNPNSHVGAIPIHAHSAERIRFSAQPIYPMTRFHANPIYPRTTFWSQAYPDIAVGPGYSIDDLANMGGPVYYPNTDIPFNPRDFDGRAR
jgi:hypothetical protein